MVSPFETTQMDPQRMTETLLSPNGTRGGLSMYSCLLKTVVRYGLWNLYFESLGLWKVRMKNEPINLPRESISAVK